MSAEAVDIGFLEDKSNWLLHPRFFPSKVGGKPSWLDLNVPSTAELTCKKCTKPLIFLCQVYAPFEEKTDCFHRTLFMFICKNGPCCQANAADNLKVLRCQLPRKNNFYSFEPSPENEQKIFAMDKWPKLCFLCGIRAPSHCSRCKKVYYCSKEHQILDWQKGHKENCPNFQQDNNFKSSDFVVTEAGKSLLFREWELLVDEEDKENTTEIDPNQEMNKLRKMVQDNKAGTLHNVSDSELEQYTTTMPEDKVFDKFRKRVARHPDQVLRYDRGGTPLWITSDDSASNRAVPNCQHCNGERQFELQIMPQLLNFIDVGSELNSIDWGVLAVFTCKSSCNSGPAYKEEFIIKQDLTNK